MARLTAALALLALLWLPSAAQAQLLIGGGASAAQGCGSHCLMAVNGDSYAGGTWVDWKAGRVVTNTDAAQDAATVWRGSNSIGMDSVDDQLSVPDSADWAAAGDFCESVWLYADPPAAGTATIWQQAGARVVGAVAGAVWVQVAPKLGLEQYIYSLAVLDGVIYGGTAPGGRLYRWDGVDEWVQVAPQLGGETYILSLAVLDGVIYGGTAPGGRLYRWDGVDEWVQVAPQLGGETYILSLAVLDGVIYGGTSPGGRLYRWDGVDEWVQVAPQLGGETYIWSLAVLDGVIYGGTAPGGRLYRWDGVDEWVQVAPKLGGETYIYSLAVLDGVIYGGTAPGGRLYRWDGVDEWVQVAPQLGGETYIWSLAVLDGVIYGGTATGGRLYRWDGVDEWVQVAPKLGGETYIYSLAVLDGVIYGGTAPGGRLAEYYPAGTVTATYTLAAGGTVALHGGAVTGAAWQQVEVCRSGGTAYLYVDGVLVDTAAAVGALANPAAPLTLGAAGTTLIGSYDEWVMTSGGWAWTRTHSPGRCVGRRC